jgi:cytochrome c peroxidase
VTRSAARVCGFLALAGACGHAPASEPVNPAPAATAYEWRLPPGAPVPIVPADNPMSEAKVDLGRRLFYDTRLSVTGTYACASCHQQARAFTDGRGRAIGATGAIHARSAMSLTNVAYNATFGWADASVRSLEAQMLVPMFNEHPVELGFTGHETEILDRLRSSTDEVTRFRRAFPGTDEAVTRPHVIAAIASFERTLISGDSPLDRYLYRDDRAALSEPAVRGMTLFFSKQLQCGECHGGFNLSGATTFRDGDPPDVVFHNTGLYNVDGRGGYPAVDQGLIAMTHKPEDMGRFRAPTLRNIAVTAPYMHDGSIPSLEAAISHYAAGGVASAFKSTRLTGFTLTDGERDDLLAFLRALTDDRFLTNPDLAAPDTPARP